MIYALLGPGASLPGPRNGLRDINAQVEQIFSTDSFPMPKINYSRILSRRTMTTE